jgi:hypothetical protein
MGLLLYRSDILQYVPQRLGLTVTVLAGHDIRAVVATKSALSSALRGGMYIRLVMSSYATQAKNGLRLRWGLAH